MNDSEIMQEVDKIYHRNKTSEGRVNAITDYITRLLREKDAELALRTQAQRDALAVVDVVRVALDEIKAAVVGESRPNWADKFAVTYMRGRIADICDAALAQLAALPPVPDSGERE